MGRALTGKIQFNGASQTDRQSVEDITKGGRSFQGVAKQLRFLGIALQWELASPKGEGSEK